MYKRCVADQRENEPRRLYFLTQFVMYDKDNKNYITEEDTLEILYIRHQEKFNEWWGGPSAWFLRLQEPFIIKPIPFSRES